MPDELKVLFCGMCRMARQTAILVKATVENGDALRQLVQLMQQQNKKGGGGGGGHGLAVLTGPGATELRRTLEGYLERLMLDHTMYPNLDIHEECAREACGKRTVAEARAADVLLFTELVAMSRKLERENVRAGTAKHTKRVIYAAFTGASLPWTDDGLDVAKAAQFIEGCAFRKGARDANNQADEYVSLRFRKLLHEIFPDRLADGGDDDPDEAYQVDHLSAAQLAWVEVLVKRLLRGNPNLPGGDGDSLEGIDWRQQYANVMNAVKGRQSQYVRVRAVPALIAATPPANTANAPAPNAPAANGAA